MIHDMSRTLSVTEAARNFSDVVNRAYYRGETTVLVRSGQPVARITPVALPDCTGAALAERLDLIRHLSPEEATAFGNDIEAARLALNTPPSRSWD